MLEAIGTVLLYAALASPVFGFIYVFRMKSGSEAGRIVLGILISLILMVIFFALSTAIALHDGLGPG